MGSSFAVRQPDTALGSQRKKSEGERGRERGRQLHLFVLLQLLLAIVVVVQFPQLPIESFVAFPHFTFHFWFLFLFLFVLSCSACRCSSSSCCCCCFVFYRYFGIFGLFIRVDCFVFVQFSYTRSLRVVLPIPVTVPPSRAPTGAVARCPLPVARQRRLGTPVQAHLESTVLLLLLLR